MKQGKREGGDYQDDANVPSLFLFVKCQIRLKQGNNMH